MILKGYPRISETFISNEILLLERLGCSIHLFSMRRPREPFCHESVRRIQARVDYLPETLPAALAKGFVPGVRLAVKRPGVYAGALRTAWHRFKRTRKAATFKHLLQAGYLVHKLMPHSGVTHLHAHFAHSPTSVAMFASLLSGVDFSFTAHAKDIYTSDPRQLKEKIHKARFVVTCTEYNRRYLKILSPNGSKPIHRIYHGIDIELFGNHPQRVREAESPVPPFQLLTVARLTPKKGLPTVLHAVRTLCDQGMPLRYTLIGDGDQRDQILSLIRELRLEQTVQWLGTLPHEQVLAHYRRADLFVLGCETAVNGDRDGIPNVLMESMAMGVPVAATRLSAIPELVDDGRTGLLVSPGNPDQLADAVKRLLTDTELRRQVIHTAGEHVRKRFNNRDMIGQLAEVYRREGVCIQ